MKKSNLTLLYNIVIILLLGTITFRLLFPNNTKLNKEESSLVGTIINLTPEDYGSVFILQEQTTKELVMCFFYDANIDLEIGNIIKINGNLEDPPQNTLPHNFSYKEYLNHNNIFFLFKVKSIEIIGISNNILYKIRNKVHKKIAPLKSKDYLEAFILGKNDLINQENKKAYRQNGLSHLLAISGSHFHFLEMILIFFLSKFKINEKIQNIILSIIFISYLMLLGIVPSALRVVIYYVLSTISLILFNHKSPIKIFFLTFIITLSINPLFIYSIGFWYSFIISFFLLNFKIKGKHYFTKLVFISLRAFLVSFPITISNFYEINILSIPYNILLAPLIENILFPLSLLTFHFSFLDPILFTLIKKIENINVFLSTIKIGILNLCSISIIIVIVYLICTYLIYKKKKYAFLIYLSLLIIHIILPKVELRDRLIMFDIGQGDSILLEYHNKVIMLDTGGNTFKKKNDMNTKIIPYLKGEGINKIDYLFLSHGDLDHIGYTTDLVNSIKVKQVIFNSNDFNEEELNVITTLEKLKIPYRKIEPDEVFSISKYIIYSINSEKSNNENQSSMVFYIESDKVKTLLMGDAPKLIEEKIIEKYNLPQIDILKVGHHGSKTSTSVSFIKKINPMYGLISVGKNNIYHHPQIEVLNNLNRYNVEVLRTDIDGTIIFDFKRGTILKYPPYTNIGGR